MTRKRTIYDNGKFGFTHLRLPKAWAVLHRATQARHTFTFLEHSNPRTTSSLEGRINAQLRYLLRHHTGMSIEHRRIKQAHHYAHTPIKTRPTPIKTRPTPIKTRPTPIDESLGQALYDTSLDAAERLRTRQSWAGKG
ncbi:hypothetical protein [Microbacterium sp. YY-01]|uniref:hypothetical protein n=1 Tax=Microbacterium sp. YY-01 TaxID=3421634 RepID=UPI003D186F6D